MKIKKINYTNR